MGQYKVPQDVEAEDKIIGFLTIKQFIYTVIGVAYGFFTFQAFRAVPVIFFIVGVPPTLLMLMLGLYQRHDQPFEAYFLAIVNYTIKPRKRIWHKDPVAQVFKIEAPKIVEEHTQRDPAEVRSRLDHIAQVVDTRGWSAKQPELQEPEPSVAMDLNQRIVTEAAPDPSLTGNKDVQLSDDILDFTHNENAQNLNQLIEDSVKSIRQEALEKMKSEAASPESRTNKPSPTQAPQLKIQDPKQSASEMTENPVAGILKLAMESADLTISQVAAQATKQAAMTEGEAVVIEKKGIN